MNRADILRTEDIRQKRRDSGKAASIHRENSEEAGQKHGPIAAGRQTGNEQEEKKLDNEEERIGIAPADIVRTGGPQKSAACVKDADDGNDQRRFSRRFRKQVLHHRRGLRENSDAGGDVDKQDSPQETELHRASRLIPGDAVRGDQPVSLGGSVPSPWFPT